MVKPGTMTSTRYDEASILDDDTWTWVSGIAKSFDGQGAATIQAIRDPTRKSGVGGGCWGLTTPMEVPLLRYSTLQGGNGYRSKRLARTCVYVHTHSVLRRMKT